jgi:hypothetical protein
MKIEINPTLPDGFWTQDIAERSEAELREWLYKPFILSVDNKYWPNGIRYDVYILNGGAHDRPTRKGSFKTEEEAIKQANKILSEYKC